MVYKKASKKEVPSKLKLEFLTYFKKLPIQKLAAESIGKDEDTITNWKKTDPSFRMLLAKAKSEWALQNVSKVKSSEWLLQRVMKEHFVEAKNSDLEVNNKIEIFLDRVSSTLPD